MYQVKLYHFYPEYRNGDREEGTEIIEAEAFKTRKAAKEYVLRKAPSRAQQSWHKGDKPSYVLWFTGHSWVNENSGETRDEKFYYKITKA